MDKSTAEEFQRKGLSVWLLGVWSAMPVKALDLYTGQKKPWRVSPAGVFHCIHVVCFLSGLLDAILILLCVRGYCYINSPLFTSCFSQPSILHL